MGNVPQACFVLLIDSRYGSMYERMGLDLVDCWNISRLLSPPNVWTDEMYRNGVLAIEMMSLIDKWDGSIILSK